MFRVKLTVISLGTLLVLAAATGAVGVQESADQGVAVEVESSPTDWDEAEATHAVVFTVGSDAESAGESLENLVVDYVPGDHPADVSNVDPDAVQWIGVDRDGDAVGTRVDDEATVTEVSARGDGSTLRVETAGDLQLSAGDEVIVVYRGVQNPQDQGAPSESEVSVTLNEDGAADVASDDVRYEYNEADVALVDQETGGDTVTVDSASLSEPGFVVVLNQSGENPDEVRGSTFLETGDHEDVVIDLEPPVADDDELHAQVHLDTDGDRRFDYDGGVVDRPFQDRDGNLLATDAAQVTYSADADSPNESDGTTPTATATETETPGDGEGDTPEDGDGDATAEGDDTPAKGTEASPTDGEAAADDEPEGDDGVEDVDPTDEDGAGFAAGAALFALVASSLLLYRRR